MRSMTTSHGNLNLSRYYYLLNVSHCNLCLVLPNIRHIVPHFGNLSYKKSIKYSNEDFVDLCQQWSREGVNV